MVVPLGQSADDELASCRLAALLRSGVLRAPAATLGLLLVVATEAPLAVVDKLAPSETCLGIEALEHCWGVDVPKRASCLGVEGPEHCTGVDIPKRARWPKPG